MIAELVEGQEVIYYDLAKKKATTISAGKYLYIKPKSSFNFTATGNENINMVLFEIK